MTTSTQAERLTLSELRAILLAVEPAAILVEPRILRRVIKQDRRLAGLALFVPHRKAYVIQRERLLVIASRSELNVEDETELPNQLILLAEPSDDESLELLPRSEALYLYWRLLFHARVHLAVEQRAAAGELGPAAVFERVRSIGLTEFEEIRDVLHRDEMLIDPTDDEETYTEFLAVYFEHQYFASGSDLPLYFPAIRDWPAIAALALRDVAADEIYEETRIPGAPQMLDRMREQVAHLERIEPEQERSDVLQPSPPQYWKLQARAERVSAIGNVVKAAIYRTRAARRALPDRAAESKVAAQAELTRLAERLQVVLQSQNSEAVKWVNALTPMLDPASRGLWSNEAKFLYDLQKVCIEHERGVYSIDLINYCLSGGNQPLRRALPLLREVLITKHLRTASHRLATARIAAASREKVSDLLEEAVERVEQQLRSRIRPIISTVLDDVGLLARNVPERVARRKLVEELLDGIVDHGYITMGHLRDAISKNNLKLPDVSGAAELLRGDQLLRADRLLSKRLDGVYRPGAIYQRVPQLLSSLAFGTSNGRLVTRYLILPYGGAFLGLEFARHLLHSLTAAVASMREPPPAAAAKENSAFPEGADAAERSTAPATSPAEGAEATPDVLKESGDAAEGKSTEAKISTEASSSVTSPPHAEAAKSEAAGAEPGKNPASADPTSNSPNRENADSTDSTGSPSNGTDPSGKHDATSRDASDVASVSDADSQAKTQSDGFSAEAAERVFAEEGIATTQTPQGVPALRKPAATWADTLEFYGLVFLVGSLVLALIHRPRFRAFCTVCLWHAWRVVRFMAYEIPSRLMQSAFMRWVLQSPLYAVVRNYLVRPAIFTAIAILGLRIWQVRLDFDSMLNVFLGINLFINSSIGRYADEWLTDVLMRAWHDLRMRLFGAAIQLILDLFHRVMENLERVLYAVDEWLRFRAGDSRISIAYKAVMSVLWSAVTYVIRIYATLLIEPQVNPIKHFPVVTVSHKIMLPYSLVLTRIVATPLEPFLGKILANAIAVTTVFLSPGLFGFLVWELKENWRLYAANRSRVLRPTIIGHHGESMPQLLRQGFHSGTAPKLFAKLRRSLRKAQRSGDWKAVNGCRAARREVERQLQRFADREFCVLLEESGFHDAGGLRCVAVRVATNRLEMDLRRTDDKSGLLRVTFEDHAPWLIASVATVGWEDSLDPLDQRRYLTALVGLLKMAAVDLIDERLRLRIDRPFLWYRCAPTGMVVVAGPNPDERQFLALVTESGSPAQAQDRTLPIADLRLESLPLIFSQSDVLWDDWIATWNQLSDEEVKGVEHATPTA